MNGGRTGIIPLMEQSGTTKFSDNSKCKVKDSKPSVVSSSSLFNDKEVIKALSGYGSKKDYHDGSVVCLESDTANDAFIVDKGLLKVFKKLNGKKVNIAEISDGDIFGEMALFSSGKRTATVQAFGPCTVIKISKDDMINAVKERPDIGLFFLHLVTTRLNSLIDHIYSQCNEGKLEPEGVIRFYSASKFRSRLSYMR